ncbi:MAG TPA: DUF502 domain-containing protein [Candidatus Deferrimicrobiaceae bacterium]
MQINLKKSFITGIFVVIPMVLSIGLLTWFFTRADGFFSPIIDSILPLVTGYPAHIPGTGIITGCVIILIVGLIARNVAGAKLLGAFDRLIHHVPVFRAIYSTIKQMTDSFSPDNTSAFKEVVLAEYPKENSYALGFRTSTVEVDGERFAVVFVPTNNLYLGEVLLIPETRLRRLDMSIELALRCLVSGGTAAPRVLRSSSVPPKA